MQNSEGKSLYNWKSIRKKWNVVYGHICKNHNFSGIIGVFRPTGSTL